MEGQIKLIQSIQRAFDIFDCFDSINPTRSLKEISQKLNLNINTTRGIMNTLVHNDYITHNQETNRYSLGPQFAVKAQQVTSLFEKLHKMCLPYLHRLANEYVASARLQLVSKSKMMTVETVESSDSYYNLSTSKNQSCPLHASASGKLLLAFMEQEKRDKILQSYVFDSFTKKTIVDRNELMVQIEEIHAMGYSYENQEANLGVSSIAAPIMYGSKIVGTISVVTTSAIMDEIREDCAKTLVQYADEISAKLAFQ